MLKSAILPGMGAIPHDAGTAFRVWAPHAEAVAVTGSFNDWSEEGEALTSEDNGHWYGDVPGAKSMPIWRRSTCASRGSAVRI